MSIKCSKCQADNPDTQSYCGGCGTQLGTPKEAHVLTKTFETPFPQYKPGTFLAGRYEIIKELGRGGMGEVYLAEDTNLKRQIAIKVLPRQFALDKERLARFEREARVLASLNHPNIATIHGLEKAEGQALLVMELVEGETLAERIIRGPLPLEEALEACRQIAEGLESAHEKGIIHRDLKPGNIKITPEDKVKVLDFGLAKVFQEESEATDISKSPTFTDQMTEPGVILGTAAYMSPEQTKGKKVDKRTDIWAFGCILFECLSGKRAFEGETLGETIASILKGEPDWAVLPKNIPAQTLSILHRCLRKDPSHRLQHIGDARIEVEEALSKGSALSPIMPETMGRVRPVKRLRPAFLIGLAAGLVAGAIATGIALRTLMRLTRSVPPPIGHFTISLPPSAPVLIFDNPSIAISPDGTSVVYSAIQGKNIQLYLRDINQFDVKPLLGTENANGPFFSSDGDWIGYFDYTAGKMKKISLRGGAPVIICDAPPDSRGASWGPDNTIVFTRSHNSGLYKVSSAGGAPEAITTLDLEQKEKTHRFPQILPDGDTVLFTIGTTEFTSYDDARIAIVSLASGEKKILLEGGSNARYAPTGHIVYARAGSLMAIPFDLKRLELTGSPVGVLEEVITSDSYGAAQFNLSPNGSLIYVRGGPENYYTKLAWVDRKGGIQSLPANPRIFAGVHCSPDGKRLAVQIGGGNEDIWIYEIQRDTLTRLTTGGDNEWPIWTPDSQRVTYRKSIGGTNNLFWKPADGSGAAEKLLGSEHRIFPNSWSPDGKILVFNEVHPSTGADILVLPIEGERIPEPFLKTSFNEGSAAFSPDGRWIAYVSDESGQFEVYVSPFPGPGRKWQISTGGGIKPKWTSDGHELVYLNSNKMMVVPVKTEPQFSPGKPKIMFEASAFELLYYDIMPDGQRFIMIDAGDHSSPPTQLNIVLNWFEELKKKVPWGK